jgi:hypothetical protein
MLKNTIVALIAMLSISSIAVESVNAQGLAGTHSPSEILGRRAYVTGKTDVERWQTLKSLQSKLLGMNEKQVKAALGDPVIGKNTFSYAITEAPISTKPNKWAHLKVFFTNGIVSKFSIESES